MLKRLRKTLALLLSLALLMTFSPVTGYAGEGDEITILMRAPVDIVFVIDSTGSMGDEINQVKQNIISFLDNLYNYSRRISEGSNEGVGIDPRIAIIDYKNVVYNENTTFHKKNDGSYWFVKTDLIDDSEELINTISDINLSGGHGDETPTEALAKLYDTAGFEWRSDAQKFVFLITDAGFRQESGVPDMRNVITELSNRNIQTSAVVPSTLSANYSPLYTGTDGKFYDIYGTLGFMEEIIKSIDEEIKLPPVNVSVKAVGAPEGIGSVKLVRYKDKDGAEHVGPSVYSCDDTVSVSVSLGSLIDLEINSNKIRAGAVIPKGKTYVIDGLTVNGKPKELSEKGKSTCRIQGLPITADTTIRVYFTIDEKDSAFYIVSFDSKGGSPVFPQRVLKGRKVSVPNNPERDGYTFNYWYLLDGNEPFDFSTSVSSDFMLTASWNGLGEEKIVIVSDNTPAGLPSDWTKLRHVTHENAISSNYCVIARKQRFDVKPHIKKAVVYKSNNKKIASVGKKNGIVKGKNSGDAEITGYVRSGGQLIPTGSYTIHVVTPELNKKQYLSFNTDGLIDGNEHIVNEILSPTLWTSSNPSVATVSSNSGMISVHNPKGKAKITAFYGLGRNAARYRFTLRIRPSGGVG